MSFNQFIKKWLGKKADWDNAYQGQCVDLFRYYCHEVLEIKQPAGVWGAANFWTDFESDPILVKHFTKVQNTSDFAPLKGDVMVWNFNAGKGFGHIGMCTGENAGTRYFKSFDQNWSRVSYCEVVNHSYKNVYGVLRPKVSTTNNSMPDNTQLANMLKKYDLEIKEDKTLEDRIKELDEKINQHVGTDWGGSKDSGYLGSARDKIGNFKETIDEMEDVAQSKEEIRKLVEKTDDERLKTLAENLDTPYVLGDKEKSWNEVVGKSSNYKTMEINKDAYKVKWEKEVEGRQADRVAHQKELKLLRDEIKDMQDKIDLDTEEKQRQLNNMKIKVDDKIERGEEIEKKIPKPEDVKVPKKSKLQRFWEYLIKWLLQE